MKSRQWPQCFQVAALFLSLAARPVHAAPPTPTIQGDSYPWVFGATTGMTLLEGDFFSLYPTVWNFGDYQWKRDGQNIRGATTPFQSFTASSGTAGTYTVTLSDFSGSSTSAPFEVEVIAKPRIASSPGPGALAGGAVTLTASLPPDISVSNVQWTRNHAPIPGANSLSLNLSDLQFGDEADYRLTATYLNGFSSSRFVSSDAFHLKIYQSFNPATIVVQPRDQKVTTGGSAVFTVGAAGSGPFAYQWLHNGTNMPGETNFFLRISNAQSANQGSYVAQVTPPAGVPGGVATSDSAVLTIHTFPVPDGTADILVSSARASLGQQTTNGISSADGTLGVALNNDPDHPTGNFFHAITRLLNLNNRPAFHSFLTRLGIDPTGRSLYNWTAGIATDVNGDILLPTGVNTRELSDFARTNMVPEIIGALSNLSKIDNPDFTVSITPQEAGFGSSGSSAFVEGNGVVTLDQGDLWLARAWLQFNEFGLRTWNSWNTASAISFLDGLTDQDSLSVQAVLQEYPDLLTFEDPSQIAPARLALEAAIDAYVQGMGVLRSRPGSQIRLFNLDHDQGLQEEQFRANLLDLKGSLEAMLTVDEQPQFRLMAGKLTDGSVSPRALAPSFAANLPIGGSAPDTSLGGAIQADGEPVLILPPTDTRASVGQSATLGTTAVGASPLAYQWNKNGTPIPGATNAQLNFPAVTSSDYGRYQVTITNTFGQVNSDIAVLQRPGGVVYAWGHSTSPVVTNIPPYVTDVVSVAAGSRHALALKSDGTVVSWGDTSFVPFGLREVIEVYAYESASYALKADGTVVGWGTAPPIPFDLNNVVQLAPGLYGALALKDDGTVRIFGNSTAPYDQTVNSLSNITFITSSLALNDDGKVFSIYPDYPPPVLGPVKSLASGWDHHLALLENGRVIGWGLNHNGQIDIPSSLGALASIHAEEDISVAVGYGGSLVAWGQYAGSIPAISGITSLSLGRQNFTWNLLLTTGPILLIGGPLDQTANEGASATFTVPEVRGNGPFTYEWRFNGNPIPGANTPTLNLTNVSPAMAGNYALVVSDGVSTVTSQPAKLSVNTLNDSLSGARSIPGGGGRLLGSNSQATKEPGEPYHAGDYGGRSLWYSWTAPATGNVTVDTLGSGFDTLLAVYTGSSMTNLTLVAADDDGAGFGLQSLVTFLATQGQTYWIAIDGFSGASGAVALNIRPQLALQGLILSATLGIQFEAFGPGTSNIVIQASSDLKKWIPVSTNLIPASGLLQVDLQESSPSTNRFYRAVTQ